MSIVTVEKSRLRVVSYMLSSIPNTKLNMKGPIYHSDRSCSHFAVTWAVSPPCAGWRINKPVDNQRDRSFIHCVLMACCCCRPHHCLFAMMQAMGVWRHWGKARL